MKKNLVFSLLFLLLVSLSSCKPGKWSDNIHLSEKTAVFRASGDSITITTRGTAWWISDIGVDTTDYYNFQDIDQTKDYYTIEEAGVTVERRGRKVLFIKADANLLPVKRTIKVGLEAGDYFDSVTITQKGK